MPRISPENAEFAIVSFEGPDEYARAGGLAVRVRDLAETLAALGFRTHLFFIGDPRLPAIETDGRLTLHRWSQWISAYHPDGVYDGEWGKMQDMAASLPSFLAGELTPQAVANGRVLVLMGEDWQTVDVMSGAREQLVHAGLPHRVIPVWTANNVFGFHDIDCSPTERAAELMTVGR